MHNRAVVNKDFDAGGANFEHLDTMIIRKKPGAVYIAVLAVAMVITMIGLAVSHLGRLQVKSAVSNTNQTYARLLAQSGVELGVARMRLDPFWRANYQHGVETSLSVGTSGESIAFRFLDPDDGDLADDSNDPIQIEGIGRMGDATFVYRVEYSAGTVSESVVGPDILKSQESTGTPTSTVDDSSTVGQYFVPDVPAEAISWSLTSFEVYAEDHGPDNGTLIVQLWHADPQGLPDVMIDTISIDESLLPGSGDWFEVNFANATTLDPSSGFCVTYSAADNEKTMKTKIVTGATQTDSHLLEGDGFVWWATTNNSLRFRLSGTYTTSEASGDFQIVPGSWRRVEAN